MGFADCKEVAITVSGQIIGSEVMYGMYTPPTNQDQWDKRWPRNGIKSFTHFWVEHDGKIIDQACDQYGESNKITTIEDIHYVKVGKLNQVYDKPEPLVEYPKIEWSTLTGPGGLVQVIWPDYDKYLLKLGMR